MARRPKPPSLLTSLRVWTFLLLIVFTVSLLGAHIYEVVKHRIYLHQMNVVRGSIVRLTLESEVFGGGICTGFVTEQGVVSAGHCAPPIPDLQIRTDGMTATVLKLDMENDLVLLNAPGVHKPPLHLRRSPARFGEYLTGVGYGFGFHVPMLSEVRVMLPHFQPEPDLHVGDLVEWNYYPGMSGGPVVDWLGRVVGVVQLTVSTTSFGVDVETLRAFLGA